jgi:DNA-binding transcriptional LysR family regulator
MDLPQLRAFIEVAREGNLTRAAAILHLSQPALSTRIRLLEEEIGLKLFERAAKGMVLTRHGEVMYADAERTLEAARSFVTRAKTFVTDLNGRIAIGTISEPVALRLGEFLSSMLTVYPHVTVSISQAISGIVVERILSRELDAGFIIGRAHRPELSSVELAPVRFLVVGPSEWSEKLLSCAWSDLENYPWVGTPPKCSYTDIIRELFSTHGINPRRVAEVDQENMIKSLVARGVGLSILREDQAIAAATAGEMAIWPHGDTHSVLSFVQRADAAGTHFNASITRVVQNVWKV